MSLQTTPPVSACVKIILFCPPLEVGLPLKASSGACCWRCRWGCPVPTSSRPPCCLPPRKSCGSGSSGRAGEPFSQSQSSKLWPSRRRRARTGASSPRPAEEGTGETGRLGFERTGLRKETHLVRLEKVWLFQDTAEFLQPLQVKFLSNKNRKKGGERWLQENRKREVATHTKEKVVLFSFTGYNKSKT